jgi:AcrR family transcriptional regulator
MPARPAPEQPTIRQRYRTQVRTEVKQAALRQLQQSGPAGLSVAAIGKELGVSGPALYRYFASRDELLTELIIDAYDDLARALHLASQQHAGTTPPARLKTLARAYRAWALDQPHRYRLLFGPPLPGYDAHALRLVTASLAAISELLSVLRELDDPAAPPPPQPLASQLRTFAALHDAAIGPAAALHAILAWSRLHGLVSLEIAGNFHSMGLNPDQLFEAQLSTLTA